MPLSDSVSQQILERLRVLYGDAAGTCLARIEQLAERYGSLEPPTDAWSERDVALITYGDQIRGEDEPPLRSFGTFLQDLGLNELVNIVHILPFCPYSSDDGFSVIDYRQVDPNLGDWSDVAALGESFDLMFDLVLNHCSSQSEWFQDALAGREPFDEYFITPAAGEDLTHVTRPRSQPLLTEFATAAGPRDFWTTFSEDQVDLDFSNPDVLLEMLDVLLSYVGHGARVIRLDAIAYLWKRPGTSCIHLPETHGVVKLMRDLLDAVAPGTILLTETNVPHDENVSYFGDGDEAQMVYQFSLAPLLLDAFLNGDALPFVDWLANLGDSPKGTTFFNFTASHDGIGVRPLEGLVSTERFDRLIAAVIERGGNVSTKRNPDGTDSPYELNITYFSALGEPGDDSAELHVRRFLSSQAVMLALKGIPGIYFHSLFATANDYAGVEETGRARTINRRKFARNELDAILADTSSAEAMSFAGYRQLIATRIQHSAFHPDAPQTVHRLEQPSVIAFTRGGGDFGPRVLVLVNVARESMSIDVAEQLGVRAERDLLDPAMRASVDCVEMKPFATRWLEVSGA